MHLLALRFSHSLDYSASTPISEALGGMFGMVGRFLFVCRRIEQGGQFVGNTSIMNLARLLCEHYRIVVELFGIFAIFSHFQELRFKEADHML